MSRADDHRACLPTNRVLRERAKRVRAAGTPNVDMEDVLDGFQKKARDHARTPVQWSAAPHAGFTTGAPWMRANDDYAQGWNVAAEAQDPDSVWRFWRRALALRRQHDVLVYGDFRLLLPEHAQVFAFTRSLHGATALVVLNFSDREAGVRVDPPYVDVLKLRPALTNYTDEEATRPLANNEIKLRGYEGRIYL